MAQQDELMEMVKCGSPSLSRGAGGWRRKLHGGKDGSGEDTRTAGLPGHLF